MKWGLVGRIAFVALIAYCGHALRPLGGAPLINIAFRAAIAGLIVFLEDRLRQKVGRS